jgi:hypothetical protein
MTIVHRLPMWFYQTCVGVGLALVLGMVLVSAWAGMTLHRENAELADKVRQSEDAIQQLVTVTEAQDAVLAKANKKLRRLGENPVASPFPFRFSFAAGGTTFTVTCTEPGADCLVQTN